MIKRVKQFQPEALISSNQFRDFVEKSESEILRGISTIVILRIIDNYGDEGIYGYQLLKDLEKSTKNMLIIEEGTLYPLLKKLEKDSIVRSEKKKVQGRKRKYYYITEEGKKVQNHLNGFFTKLVESMSNLLDINIKLDEKHFLYCPNCANKIDLGNKEENFCEVCGLNIAYLKEEK